MSDLNCKKNIPQLLSQILKIVKLWCKLCSYVLKSNHVTLFHVDNSEDTVTPRFNALKKTLSSFLMRLLLIERTFTLLDAVASKFCIVEGWMKRGLPIKAPQSWSSWEADCINANNLNPFLIFWAEQFVCNKVVSDLAHHSEAWWKADISVVKH